MVKSSLGVNPASKFGVIRTSVAVTDCNGTPSRVRSSSNWLVAASDLWTAIVIDAGQDVRGTGEVGDSLVHRLPRHR